MKKIILFFLLSLHTLCHSFWSQQYVDPEIPPFILITIPKSGSHLAIKALHMLTGSTPVWHTRFPSLFTVPPKEGFLYTHFCVSPELQEDHATLGKIKTFALIRDLRDVCLSMIHQIQKGPWPGLPGEKREAFLNMPFDEQLLFVINYDYDVHEVAKRSPNSLQVSIQKVAEQALQYCTDPDNFVCRYENLVGSQGGGTEEAQCEELMRMAEYLGVVVSGSDIQQIASMLYGDEVDVFKKPGFRHMQSTFHRGVANRWAQFFKEEHKVAFKKNLGKYLIALGYEQDDEW